MNSILEKQLLTIVATIKTTQNNIKNNDLKIDDVKSIIKELEKSTKELNIDTNKSVNDKVKTINNSITSLKTNLKAIEQELSASKSNYTKDNKELSKSLKIGLEDISKELTDYVKSEDLNKEIEKIDNKLTENAQKIEKLRKNCQDLPKIDLKDYAKLKDIPKEITKTEIVEKQTIEKTPDIEIGEVRTLDPGNDANVYVKKDKDKYKLDFEIPRGVTGGHGRAGQDGLTTSVNEIEQVDGNINLTTDDIPNNSGYTTREDVLLLDQTTPQTVENGMPDFKGGISVQTIGNSIFFSTNCPVVYEGNNCYVPYSYDEEDDYGITVFWYINGNYVIFDDGETVDPIVLDGLDAPTIMLTILRANFGSEEEPYYLYITGYHDTTEALFTTYVNELLGTGGLLLAYHSETAFTYNSTTDNYDTTMTLETCPTSDYGTEFQTPPAILAQAGGFRVEQDTANITATGDITHIGNYINTNPDNVFRSYGKIQIGDGDLIGVVPTPFISNFKVTEPNSLGNNPAFGSISMVQLEFPDETTDNCFAAGVYGATYVGGTDVTYQGQAVGLWFSLALTGENCSLDKGYGIKTGVSSNGGSLHLDDFTSVYSEAVNLIDGTHTIDNLKHFEVGDISSQFTITNNYGLYIEDNSSKATNSWGLYSLEPSNYAKRLYLGTTAVKPTSLLHLGAGTSTVAPLKLTAGTLLSTPETGAIEFANNRVYITNKSLQKAIDRTSDVKTTTTIVTNTTTETTVFTASVPANSWVAGNILKLYMAGKVTNKSSAQDITLRVKVGGDTIATLTSVGGKLTNACCEVQGTCIVRSVGETGSMAWHLDQEISGEVSAKTCGVNEIDTTGALDITVTAQWSSADADNILNCTMGFMEYKN